MIRETKATRVPRIDGPLKVAGQAKYAADRSLPGMLHAVPLCATIGKGKISRLDTAAAERLPGMVGVISHKNIGEMHRVPKSADMDFKLDEPRLPFEDETIRYYGQYVALAVADSLEAARAGAAAIEISYESEKPNLDAHFEQEDLKKIDTERGNAESDFKRAKFKLDETYITPIEVHCAIELHATVAHWESSGRLTVYESTQAAQNNQNVLAAIFGLPKEQVRVISEFLGSGFGGKAWIKPHAVMACAASRMFKRPVKLVTDRHMGFTNMGHRPRTQQRIRLGCDEQGNLLSLQHDYASQSSPEDEFKENCGEASGLLYRVPSVRITSGVARRNQGVPAPMRGPGAVPGLFALESALDELAVQMKMDPAELRLRNDVLEDQVEKKKFSSRHLKECIELGSEKFGWRKRNAAIGSMRDGDEILGWGMASCNWIAGRFAADATFRLTKDGTAVITSGTHDIGTGMYTVLAELVRQETGIPHSRIEVRLGDSAMPKGALAGGSMASASMVPPVLAAIRDCMKNFSEAAMSTQGSPHFKKQAGAFKEGKLGGVDFAELLKSMKLAHIEGKGSSTSSFASPGEFSIKSFGAHFVEMGWNPSLARMRVRRMLSVIDAGKIINYRQARNQIEGAQIMGIGMGLFEEATYDLRDGNVSNKSLADYVVPVHADAPELDVHFLDYPDTALNEIGARGIGEIGLAGVAAAIANGVYHATGIRVRDLPISIDKLLKERANA
jgi:xanthine dehydrogenase YagR molybdenum-binding subunit